MAESDNPSHYKDKPIESWDAIISQLSEEESIGYLRGSSMKHLMRFGSKGGITIEKAKLDIKKTIKYCEKLLVNLEKLEITGAKVTNTPPPSTNITNLFKDKT